MANDEVVDVRDLGVALIEGANADVDLAVSLGEARRHLALNLGAHGARHGREIEAEPGKLFAVEADLDLGVPHLGRGSEIDETGDIGKRRGNLSGGIVEFVNGVGVDLDLNGCSEREERRSLEVEMELLGLGQTRSQTGDDRLLLEGGGPRVHSHLDPSRVLTLGSGGGQRQARAARD